jgi:hypothetical protein
MITSLTERLGMHVKNLGRLSLSILEYYVSQVTGDTAVAILREPYEREKRLAQFADVLVKTENDIKALIPVEILNANIEQPDSFVRIMESFQQDVDFRVMVSSLMGEFRLAFPSYSIDALGRYAKAFASRLEYNMIGVSEGSLADRVSALTLLDIKQELTSNNNDKNQVIQKQQIELLERIFTLLEKLTTQYLSQGFMVVVGQARSVDEETLLGELQDAVESCPSLADPRIIQEIAHKLKVKGISGRDTRTDIERVVNNFTRALGTMVPFLEELRKNEEVVRGAYSDYFWAVVEKWCYYPKSEVEQKQFVEWIKSFSESLNPMQKLKANGYFSL